MILERLRIGQKVWVMEEFPVQLTIIEIDKDKKEVWCDDDWNHSPDEIYSSQLKCKNDN